jgi:hypothetical protein
MRVSAEAFWSPKAGNQELEYEDAFSPERPLISTASLTFRFAIADGATETSFSGVWAKQLVRAFVKGDLEGQGLPDRLRQMREKWHNVVSRKPLPWYAEEKIRSGAFAAVVGLTLKDRPELEEDGEWSAFAIGDSCVFQLRERELIASFPIRSSEEFNNSPVLLGSGRTDDQTDLQALVTREGKWRRGDTFYMMTDAIACWFLTRVEDGRVPSRELQDLSHGKSKHFRSWLAKIRERKLIRNDDVTIVRIEIEKW